MLVQEGDSVVRGAPLFCHKDAPDAMMVAPVSGRVVAINRGARRVLQSVVIEVTDVNDAGVDFSGIGDADSAEGVTAKLCAAGLWTSFRTRPYSKMPNPGAKPDAIFVTAMDSDPLAADAATIIAEAPEEFSAGLAAVSTLTEGKTYLCQKRVTRYPAQMSPVSKLYLSQARTHRGWPERIFTSSNPLQATSRSGPSGIRMSSPLAA